MRVIDVTNYNNDRESAYRWLCGPSVRLAFLASNRLHACLITAYPLFRILSSNYFRAICGGANTLEPIASVAQIIMRRTPRNNMPWALA